MFIFNPRPSKPRQIRVTGTDVELNVIFKPDVPVSALPDNTVVAQTLEALNDSSNALNITIVPSSIQIICKLTVCPCNITLYPHCMFYLTYLNIGLHPQV